MPDWNKSGSNRLWHSWLSPSTCLPMGDLMIFLLYISSLDCNLLWLDCADLDIGL